MDRACLQQGLLRRCRAADNGGVEHQAGVRWAFGGIPWYGEGRIAFRTCSVL